MSRKSVPRSTQLPKLSITTGRQANVKVQAPGRSVAPKSAPIGAHATPIPREPVSTSKEFRTLDISKRLSVYRVLEINTTEHSESEILSNLDFQIVYEGDIVYIVVCYIFQNDNPIWGRIRGWIIRDFTYVVCRSWVDADHIYARSLKSLRIDEQSSIIRYEKNGVEQTLDLAQGLLRPLFQGFQIRVWRQNGVTHYSTIRRFDASKSRWLFGSKEDNESLPNFRELFRAMGGEDLDCFDNSFLNSPYCHTFLVIDPRIQRTTFINSGDGYAIYIGSIQCYVPDASDTTQDTRNVLRSVHPIRQANQLASRKYLTELSQEHQVPETERSPIVAYPIRDFVPMPTSSTSEYNRVFRVMRSMNFFEADTYLSMGASRISYRDQNLLEANCPDYLPGEELLFVQNQGPDSDPKLFIITSEAARLRSNMLGSFSPSEREVCLLLDVAVRYHKKNHMPQTNPRAEKTAIDTIYLDFEKVCEALRGCDQDNTHADYYRGFNIREVSSKITIADEDLDTVTPVCLPSELEYISASQTVGTSQEASSLQGIFNRWAVLALAWWLCIPPVRRRQEWSTFYRVMARANAATEWLYNNASQVVGEFGLLDELAAKNKRHVSAVNNARYICEQALKEVDGASQHQRGSRLRKSIRRLFFSQAGATMYAVMRAIDHYQKQNPQ